MRNSPIARSIDGVAWKVTSEQARGPFTDLAVSLTLQNTFMTLFISINTIVRVRIKKWITRWLLSKTSHEILKKQKIAQST